ncbi:MAG TPA: SH3 domain-containing protein [Thermomicrobiales bacterium]|nr:SH3 domain-containing protein [Thermomicrobiales bacterium]
MGEGVKVQRSANGLFRNGVLGMVGRWLSVGFVAFMMIAGFAMVRPEPVAASSDGVWAWSAWAMVDADSLNVRADASLDAAVIDKYGAGEWIEIIGNEVNGFSPTNYFGDVAWVAAKYLSWDGTYAYASVGQTGGGTDSSSASGEHWIQVNGGTGEVNLMIGNSVYATYWGSVGFDTSSDGFYSTASGTFYVYAMYEPLGYTKWADSYISHWIAYDSARSNGFHSYSKDASGNVLPNGAGKTGGCVALPAGAIQDVWNFSFIGMRVEVYR